VRGIRAAQCPMGAGEHVGERGLVCDPSRHLQRLAHQHRCAILSPRVGNRSGEATQQLRTQCAVFLAEQRQCALQHVSDGLSDRARPFEAVRPAEAERRTGQRSAIALLVSELGGLPVGVPGVVEFACAPVCFAEREQELTAALLMRFSDQREHLKALLVVGGGLLVAQASSRAASRGESIGGRLVTLAVGGGVCEVMRERINLGLLPADCFECFAELAVSCS